MSAARCSRTSGSCGMSNPAFRCTARLVFISLCSAEVEAETRSEGVLKRMCALDGLPPWP